MTVTATRVDVTAEDIAAGASDLRRQWALPVERALDRLTGERSDIDGGGPIGPCVATIGQGAWTLVVDLPPEATTFLDGRWTGVAGEPFSFELEVPEWIRDLVESAT